MGLPENLPPRDRWDSNEVKTLIKSIQNDPNSLLLVVYSQSPARNLLNGTPFGQLFHRQLQEIFFNGSVPPSIAESEVAEGSMDESETVETPPVEEDGAAMDIDVDSNAANEGAEVLLSLGKQVNPDPIHSNGNLSETSSVLSQPPSEPPSQPPSDPIQDPSAPSDDSAVHKPYSLRSQLGKRKHPPLATTAEDIRPIKKARRTASRHELLMKVERGEIGMATLGALMETNGWQDDVSLKIACRMLRHEEQQKGKQPQPQVQKPVARDLLQALLELDRSSLRSLLSNSAIQERLQETGTGK